MMELVNYTENMEPEIFNGILGLYKEIFGDPEEFISKLNEKQDMVCTVAIDKNKVIGFKIGYKLSEQTFYSWMGGVDEQFRNQRIGEKLMQSQHRFLKEEGYKSIQTKTMNRWKGMLILNLKNGFDITDTYIDDKGWHKIALEKELID